jgi:DNA-binding transcriptional ArsR family regulator
LHYVEDGVSGRIEKLNVLKALADPTRLAILESLGENESTPSALAARLEMSQPAVSNHLRILRDAGLVQSRRQAQMRLYSLRVETLHEAICLLASLAPVAHCRACPERPFCRRGSGAL